MGAKIVHERDICIGCAVCPAISPNFWEIKAADGKADLKGAKKVENNFELDIQDADVGLNKDAAEGCPVNCIHVFDKSGKKII